VTYHLDDSVELEMAKQEIKARVSAMSKAEKIDFLTQRGFEVFTDEKGRPMARRSGKERTLNQAMKSSLWFLMGQNKQLIRTPTGVQDERSS